LSFGDGRWRDLLARHDQAVRAVLDRFRGREVATTGDGFVAIFDGAERAICAS
jgi:class 3 adenylate cyclase